MATAKANILIVDDSQAKLLAMSVALAELGQNIVTAQSGREALRQLLTEEFAVILLDIHMPEMDGFETAALIRKRKRSAHVPIIFVTAYDDDAYAAQGYSLGAVDYVLTPVVPEVLRAKVGVFVELFRQRMQIKEQAVQQVALAHEQAARKTAEAANRLKDEFLAILSHELRTPLSAILGWVQLLQMSERTDALVDNGLEVIERNARAQAKIIEDLLDVSRIISGKLQLELKPSSIPEIVEAAMAGIRPEAESKHIALRHQVEGPLPQIEVDPTRLQQIVWNLLSNAVKFTPKGGQVSVAVRRAAGKVQISVRDTGDGIKPEFLPFVFDRFRQADASTTRSHGGLGLGLAIVRQLTELHGGEIEVASDGLGKGSMFTVRLPVKPLATRPAVVEGESPAEAPSSGDGDQMLVGIHVLVVDDQADAREMIQRILMRFRAEVTVAGSTTEALDVAQRVHPDVLVSDIGMPDRDGYELIREIRRRTPAGELPAIALTAYARPEERQKAIDAGFQVHLAKPVDAKALAALVARLAAASSGKTNGRAATMRTSLRVVPNGSASRAHNR